MGQPWRTTVMHLVFEGCSTWIVAQPTRVLQEVHVLTQNQGAQLLFLGITVDLYSFIAVISDFRGYNYAPIWKLRLFFPSEVRNFLKCPLISPLVWESTEKIWKMLLELPLSGHESEVVRMSSRFCWIKHLSKKFYLKQTHHLTISVKMTELPNHNFCFTCSETSKIIAEKAALWFCWFM